MRKRTRQSCGSGNEGDGIAAEDREAREQEEVEEEEDDEEE